MSKSILFYPKILQGRWGTMDQRIADGTSKIISVNFLTKIVVAPHTIFHNGAVLRRPNNINLYENIENYP